MVFGVAGLESLLERFDGEEMGAYCEHLEELDEVFRPLSKMFY